MAEDKKKKAYPKLPRANWFALREKFKQKPPAEVSASYIASALQLSPASAANLVSPLKALGLINEANKPTDLAFEWRDDATYSSACKKMLEMTYPQEVLDLYHAPEAKLKDVSNWFARSTRSGESTAGAYAALYVMLLEADPSKAKEVGTAKLKPSGAVTVRTAKPAQPTKVAKTSVSQNVHKSAEPTNAQHEETEAIERRGSAIKTAFAPKLHVDIQIHISPDSTPEQIDKIFESMAKHLPLRG